MPRPTTKNELIEAANGGFEKLWQLIDLMTEEELDAVFDFSGFDKKEAHWLRDKNIRDVLIHLYEWHRLLVDWVRANQSGEEKPFLPVPYNWKTYGDMNIGFWEKHQNTSYEKSIDLLNASHAEVVELIEGFADDELFTKKAFSWVGGSTLGSYCTSATSSHYDWAMKKIKAHIKIVRETK